MPKKFQYQKTQIFLPFVCVIYFDEIDWQTQDDAETANVNFKENFSWIIVGVCFCTITTTTTTRRRRMTSFVILRVFWLWMKKSENATKKTKHRAFFCFFLCCRNLKCNRPLFHNRWHFFMYWLLGCWIHPFRWRVLQCSCVTSIKRKKSKTNKPRQGKAKCYYS